MVFGPSEGEAFIDVHANTSPYERELERKLRQSSDDAEKILDHVGKQWGEHLAKSTSEEIERHGPDFTKAVENGIRRSRVVHIGGVKYLIDDQGRIRDLGGRFAQAFSNEVRDEFDRLNRPGGPISNIGRGIADAIGAGFNISGKSPLIAILAPAIGAIAGLIAAAIQAVNALLALLYTLPALIASIGIQVGVLMIAFQGLGTAISGAFAAKNARELNEAIKNLTPSAQAFVRSLIPLRNLFSDIKQIVQENFFRALGTPLQSVLDALHTILTFGLGDVATSLGSFFRDLAGFFASPTFVAFARDIFPATVRWIQAFGPAFIKLLSVLISAADRALPFLEFFGRLISVNLGYLADVLRKTLISGKFTDWLSSMQLTLESVFELFAKVTEFLVIFLAQLDKAGGRSLIDELANFFDKLAFFLATPAGQKALEGLVNIMLISIKVTGGLLIALLAVFALLELMGESVGAFLGFVANDVGPAIGDLFSNIGGLFSDLGARVAATFTAVRNTVVLRFTELMQFIRGLPERAKTALGNLKDTLFSAGRALVQGLINGVLSMGSTFANAIKSVVSQAARFLPGSPAEEGPLAGEGYTLYRGQRMMKDFIKGVKMEAPEMGTVTRDAVSNVNFGRGAIQVGFSGEIPTEKEARRTGTSVGEGINAILASQRTRLAVRTL